MSTHSQIALLGRRAGLSNPEADAFAGQMLAAHRAEVLREVEGIASELFDAADERGDRAGADMAEQIADRLARMADVAEGGAA